MLTTYISRYLQHSQLLYEVDEFFILSAHSLHNKVKQAHFLHLRRALNIVYFAQKIKLKSNRSAFIRPVIQKITNFKH